tara:strand:+ start:136 stop:360 length:225 start_codon:yes stop_codon:yes gene_type:complete
MSKNAYQIRQELLYLAHNLVREKKENSFRVAIENNIIREKIGKDPIELPESSFSVTEEEIFSVAQKLNNFVSNK